MSRDRRRRLRIQPLVGDVEQRPSENPFLDADTRAEFQVALARLKAAAPLDVVQVVADLLNGVPTADTAERLRCSVRSVQRLRRQAIHRLRKLWPEPRVSEPVASNM